MVHFPDSHDPVLDAERVRDSVKAHVERLIRAKRGWCRRISAVLRQRVSYKEQPEKLAICLQLNFDAALWPDRLLVAFEEYAEGANAMECSDYDAYDVMGDALVDRFGDGSEARSYAKWLRGTEAYSAMRKLCRCIPNSMREEAFSVWRGEVRPDVLLYLICFPDFSSLLKVYPVLAVHWALEKWEPSHMIVWEDEILRSGLARELALGARYILGTFDLPTNRTVLRTFAKQGRAYRNMWREGAFRALAYRGMRDWNCLLELAEPIPEEMLCALEECRVWPRVELMKAIHREYLDGEVYHVLMSFYKDSYTMLFQEDRSAHYLGEIRTLTELRDFHDRLIDRAANSGLGSLACFDIEPPLAPMSGMEAITDHKMLAKASSTFRNCSAFYASKVRDGRYAIYTVGSEAMVGLSLNRGASEWKLDQIFGPGNRRVSDRLTRRVRQWLKKNQPTS